MVFQFIQAFAAKAVFISFFNKSPLFEREIDAIALAMRNIAYPAFKSLLATGAFFFFMLAHKELRVGKVKQIYVANAPAR